jgi:hypothetical protein
VEEFEFEVTIGEVEGKEYAKKEKAGVIDKLREASISYESHEIRWSLTEKQEAAEETDEKGIDETHLEIEHASEIGKITSQDLFRGEEECCYVITRHSEESFLEGEDQESDPRRKGAEDEQGGIGEKRGEKALAYTSRLEEGVEAERDGHQDHFDPDAVGDADIGRVPEESEEALEKSSESVKLIKAPEVPPLEDPGVDNGRGKNDEKTEKQNVSCLFQIDGTGPPDDRKHDQEGAEEKEEGVGKFEEEKEERAFPEEPESVLYGETGDDERKKGHAE